LREMTGRCEAGGRPGLREMTGRRDFRGVDFLHKGHPVFMNREIL